MNTKGNLRAQRTQRKISEAYLALVTAEPDARVKVVDLCQRAGINRATFYAHYSDVEEVAEDVQATIMESLSGILDIGNLTTRKLSDAFTQILKLIRNNKKFFYHVFVMENAASTLNVLGQAQILEKIMEARDKSIDERKFEYQMDFFNGGMASLVKLWLKKDCKTPISVLVEILNEKIQDYYEVA
jgi:AcrR family transcriptional regulator